jgi:hypothetical protein
MLKLIALSVLLTGVAAPEAARSQTVAAAAEAAQQVYVAAYRRGPRFDSSRGLMEQAGVAEHMAHIRSIAPSVIAASPVEPAGDDLLGYVVFTAPDRQAAEAWLKADPALAAGSLSGRVHRWSVPRIKAWPAPAAPAVSPAR